MKARLQTQPSADQARFQANPGRIDDRICKAWPFRHFLGLIRILVVGLLFVPSTRVLAEPAPSVAVTLIKEQERLYRELINRNEAEFAVVFDYLRELKTGSNWSTTLHKSPKEFPRLVRPLHEVMQFYFAGRKHYDEEESIDTLLDLPRVPFDIAKSLDASELTQLARADLQLRIAWLVKRPGFKDRPGKRSNDGHHRFVFAVYS
ncbi:MAG: hypothetical protein KA236_07970 [Verrucomicrobia bacterium]|nr:hypothetical protein [Verrucomicrobiota bacterium]